MNKNDVFYGTRIFKEREDESLEKGDVGWVKDGDLPHLTCRIRFLLKDVLMWEEWVELPEAEPYYKEELSPKIRVYFENSPTVILVIHIEEFDKIMEEYLSRKILIKSN